MRFAPVTTPAASGIGASGLHPFGRHSLTLPRPGEQRKDTCLAAGPSRGVSRFKVSRSHPIPPVKADFPVPILGLMEPTPAPVKALFPAPCCGQMEFI